MNMQVTKKFGSKIFRFLDFQVYQNAKVFRREVKNLSKSFPKEEQFVLTQQLWRALDSILLNIAEGSVKYSDIDFRRFLNISLASLNEVVACLELACDDGYISDEQLEDLLMKSEGIARQLRAFSGKLGKHN